MKRIMVVVAIVMVLTLALSAGTASANPGWGGGYGGNQYIVQRGDTLSSIAFQLGVNPFELARMNRLANPNLIFVGQCLIIPAPRYPEFPKPVFNQGGQCCEPYGNWGGYNGCQNDCQNDCNWGGNYGCCEQANYGCCEQDWNNCYGGDYGYGGGYMPTYGTPTGYNGWGNTTDCPSCGRLQSKG